ncbi:MAG: single-stranded-DNA-specific exonuclease RecJ [bacterium]|nr:single-stranded-DNA-specific exonuclease RecJ [bacterium]
MSSATKRWITAPKGNPEYLKRFSGMSPVLAQVLFNRGYTTPEEAARFLHASTLDTGAFLTLKRSRDAHIDRAVSRIRAAIARKERIIIYGDFDADGVTSTVLLVQALKSLGAEVAPYIPHRVDEGYGLNADAMLKLARSGAKLVITVDCGIRSVQEVEDGRAYGLDIIITDHHSVGPEIPNALAVINPKMEDCAYSEPMLAGVGVAYRLAEALLTVHARFSKNGVKPVDPDHLLDLVAIGTVADLAPLNSVENRALVRRGLAIINANKRLGLNALIDVAQLKSGVIRAESIGFTLGPRINAAGRLDSAMEAYHLLASGDDQKAVDLALKLQALNTRRQELTREAQETIRTQIEAAGESDSPLIFASHASFQPGIVGLVAGRLTEEFFRPAVVMEEGAHESRASCRSIPQFDITRALDQCASLLVRHGGHAQAAGFTVLNENIGALRERLTDIARETLEGQELRPTLEIDAELDPALINLNLTEELQLLEPTGHGNPTPVFMSRGLRVIEVRPVGKEDRHLKLKLARPNQAPLDAIGFNLGERAAKLSNCVDVAYQLEVNEWNGTRSAQLVLQDVRPAGEDL